MLIKIYLYIRFRTDGARDDILIRMMLRYSLDLDKEADAIEAAVAQVLKEGYRTVDIMADGMQQCSTTRMGDLIAERV